MLFAGERIAAPDLATDAVAFLIDDRPLQPDIGSARAHRSGRRRDRSRLVGAVEREANLFRIGVRRDDEVELELAVVAVVDEIDSAIDVGVA